MSSYCKHCKKSVDMPINQHRRWHCPAKVATTEAKPVTNGIAKELRTFDPIAMIANLNAEIIRSEIDLCDRRKKSLVALLSVAEANDPTKELVKELLVDDAA